MTGKNLREQLAEDAAFAVSDLFDDEEWEDFEALPPAEKIRWRYCHADCDDFALALHEITGWEVCCLGNTSGPVHRLVQTPDGRLLDAGGWATLDDLKKRYRSRGLRVLPDCRSFGSLADSSEERLRIVEAIEALGVEPFSNPQFTVWIRAYRERLAG